METSVLAGNTVMGTDVEQGRSGSWSGKWEMGNNKE